MPSFTLFTGQYPTVCVCVHMCVCLIFIGMYSSFVEIETPTLQLHTVAEVGKLLDIPTLGKFDLDIRTLQTLQVIGTNRCICRQEENSIQR